MTREPSAAQAPRASQAGRHLAQARLAALVLEYHCFYGFTDYTANYKIAIGYQAGRRDFPIAHITGGNNAFLGAYGGPGIDGETIPITNATAIGANAIVSQSNSLVLGSIEGLNGADASVNVGIGTATPAYPLDVVGTVNASVAYFAGGSCVAGSCPSDARFKTNIQAFPPVLAKLVQLRPVNFSWRAKEFPEMHFGTSPSYGLIAQEVEKIFPEMVGRDEHGYRTVDYSRLPLLLIQGVRELKAENDAMKAENEGLRQQVTNNQEVIRQLSEQLAALAARLNEIAATHD